MTPAGIEPAIFRFVAQHLNHCATAVPNNNNNNKQEFMYRDTANVEPEMYDCTRSNLSHWNNNEKLKEKFGKYTRKTLDTFTTKDSYTWNITHNMESTAV